MSINREQLISAIADLGAAVWKFTAATFGLLCAIVAIVGVLALVLLTVVSVGFLFAGFVGGPAWLALWILT